MARAPAPGAEAGRAVARPAGPLRRLAGRLTSELRFWDNVLHDALRFRRHAWMHGVASGPSRTARMLADAHFLEYGMALSRARPGFGIARAARLAQDLRTGDAPAEVAGIGLRTLQAWAGFNAATALPGEVSAALEAGSPDPGAEGGVEETTGQAIRQGSAIDYLRFARSRRSVRSFAPGEVPEAVIRRAVAAAQHAPSSCNRQTCRALVWTDPGMVSRVRRHQSGNRTFGHELAGIAVVASDLRHWEHSGEHAQARVDGGLFAMSLLHGLHAEGLGTCMLNWSVDRRTDAALRAEIGLGDQHLVIVLIGFGWLPERLKLCRSARLPVDEALSLNPPLAGTRPPPGRDRA
ncbi:nitroreductase family protein [Oceanicella sp. SM1341]|uniref:nitroreductase family protein n=1 Tax=Oceanicella sp. SM1341 TaxID=1548889 RepID=UPI000E53DD14|nr:nitroreductase family protein [Oceanicella sp. SM1341]